MCKWLRGGSLLGMEERTRGLFLRKKINSCWCHGNAVTCWECMKYCTCYQPNDKEDYLPEGVK